MSQENVDLVRRLYEGGALDRRSDALRDLLDPEVVFVNPPEAVEAGTRRGFDEVVAALENVATSFDESEHKLRELFDAGEAVVAQVIFYARGRDSEAQLAQEEAHTWTFRDGRIISFEWGRDLPAALAAVGLSE